jgi:TatD DNase family protein
MRFFDTHAHISGEKEEVDRLLAAALEAQVAAIMDVCVDEPSLDLGLLLKKGKTPPRILLAAATTPHDVAKQGSAFFPIVEKKISENALDAIGETGLDYYYSYSPKEVQKEFFLSYLRLGLRAKLPLIIHCREAFSDLFDLYDFETKGTLRQDILHCFTGSAEEAKCALDRGFFISFSGIVTFPKAQSLRKVIEYIPLDRMLIETDSPYLAPHPHRGKKNEPCFVPLVAETCAQIKKCSQEEVGEATYKNAELAFHM